MHAFITVTLTRIDFRLSNDAIGSEPIGRPHISHQEREDALARIMADEIALEGRQEWDHESQYDEYDVDYPSDEEFDESMDGDFDSAMASAGFGTDEDYGFFGDDQEIF